MAKTKYEFKNWEHNQTPNEESDLPNTYPPFLKKACLDNYQYTVKLAGDDAFNITHAVPISKKWVRLFPDDVQEANSNLPFPQRNRGIEVRVTEIIWISDHDS
jgi:hypothetical protein